MEENDREWAKGLNKEYDPQIVKDSVKNPYPPNWDKLDRMSLGAEQPANYYGEPAVNSSSVNQAGQLETKEQESNRLMRRLNENLQENELRIRVLRDMLLQLEIYQKKSYYLRDSIQNVIVLGDEKLRELKTHLK
jgi:hypothetical protein